MSDSHRRLRRPDSDATAAEVAIYRREVAAALEAVGVGYGDEFIVIPAEGFQEQQSLGDQQLGPFARDSETSRNAALDTYPRQGGHRHRILMVFAAQIADRDGGYLGYTRDEVERITHLSGNTVRPRIQELIGAGFLHETHETRRTRNGSEASVIKLTTRGRDEIAKHERTKTHA